MYEEPAEYDIKQYIATAAAEGAMWAAQRFSDALGVSLDSVLDAVRGSGYGSMPLPSPSDQQRRETE
jgi:hypothetical protein